MKNGIAGRKGFGLVELLVTAAIAAIVILGIGVTIMDNHRGWQKMYSRVYSDAVIDGHVARRTFDEVVRKSRAKNILLDETGDQLELRYFSNIAAKMPDRYAKFYLAGTELKLEQGIWNAAETNPKSCLTTATICSNVSSCGFARENESVQMVLQIDNGARIATVVSSALMHN
ncbi:MAG: prepilin-type N-terminal cleavage/methylation domain-containing protein [Sedimentisphaerales bacterium]|nr:prepilin-type N-terminal cleavage/methylation domain-containing protein [Sedimentisphaerales bacterium]